MNEKINTLLTVSVGWTGQAIILSLENHTLLILNIVIAVITLYKIIKPKKK